MALKTDYQRLIVDNGDTTVTISAGQTLSNTFNPGGAQIRGLYLPSNWTPCNISFYTSKYPNFSPFFLKTDVDGSPLIISTVSAQDLPLLAYLFDYTTYLRIVCDTVQVSSVTIDFALTPIYKGIK